MPTITEHAYAFLKQHDELKNAERAREDAECQIRSAEKELKNLAVTMKTMNPAGVRRLVSFADRIVEITDEKISVVEAKDGSALLPKPRLVP